MGEPMGEVVDGMLREQRGRAEMYRRQLGGTQAALNRSKQRCAELEGLVRDMLAVLRYQAALLDGYGDSIANGAEAERLEARAAGLGVGL